MQQLGKRLLNWWSKYSKIIKVVFVTSVLVFVILALGNFFKTVKWHEVGVGLANLSWESIILLLITGCIAVIPMLGYDFAITHLLPGKFKKSYIIRCGWITNTLTNIAGFGGILGSTLRAYFYRKNATKKEILLAISKIAVFLLSGLSVLCWVALIDLLNEKVVRLNSLVSFSPTPARMAKHLLWFGNLHFKIVKRLDYFLQPLFNIIP